MALCCAQRKCGGCGYCVGLAIISSHLLSVDSDIDIHKCVAIGHCQSLFPEYILAMVCRLQVTGSLGYPSQKCLHQPRDNGLAPALR